MQVVYQDQSFNLPAEALGGVRGAPLLKPADELLLNWWQEQEDTELVVLHDHFGVLTTVATAFGASVTHCSDSFAHHRRVRESLAINGLPARELGLPYPNFAPATSPSLALLHLPKYLDLFDSYLRHLTRQIPENFQLATAFQTRHFTPRILEIAGRYANKVEQSRAYKKARTLVLSDWKRAAYEEPPTAEINFQGKTYQQLPGVFSAGHIDYATQFLLEQWGSAAELQNLSPPEKILDIGIGNGVIGDQLLSNHYPAAALFGTDVSHVAIQSARLNNSEADYTWTDKLTDLPGGTYDLIVTNPPFHEGHRNVIDTTLGLFKQAAERLAPGGNLVVVANRHLNYATHLQRICGNVLEVAGNNKFVIYKSTSRP